MRDYTHPWHRSVPLTAVLVGFVYGAFQAYARAFYAELIPRGEEAKWYALFSITDKVRELCSLGESETPLIYDLSVLFVRWPFGRGLNRRLNRQHTLRFFLCGLHDMACRSNTYEC